MQTSEPLMRRYEIYQYDVKDKKDYRYFIEHYDTSITIRIARNLLFDSPYPNCPEFIDLQIYLISYTNPYYLVSKNHVKILGVSHLIDAQYWNGYDLTYDSEISLDDISTLLDNVKQMTIRDNLGGSNIIPSINECDLLRPIFIGYNFKQIISDLEKFKLVKTRDTDHEFRDDTRNLTWISGYDINSITKYHEYPADGLDLKSDVGKHIFNLLKTKLSNL